jgi:hypothetical protein
MPRYKIFFIIFLVNLSVSILQAQNKYDLKQLGDEAIKLIERPIKWNGAEYLLLGAIFGGTYGLMHIDEDVRDLMRADTSWRGSIPLEIGRYWGEPLPALVAGAGLLLQGIINKNTANKKLGFEITQSMIYSGTVNGMIKIVLGRARPFTNADAFTFLPMQSINDDDLSLAFSLSTVLAQNTQNNLLKTAAYIPAFVTAFSRVNYDKHWVSDVFLGAFTGYFIAKYVTGLHDRNSKYEQVGLPAMPIISLNVLL